MKYAFKAGFVGFAVLAVMSVLSGCTTEWRKPMVSNPNHAITEAHIVVRQSIGDENKVIRTRALEAVALFMSPESHSLLLQALNDKKSQSVRIAAALAIGDLKYAPAEKRLLEMISTDKKVGERYIRVLPSICYALSRLGHEKYMTVLGHMLTSQEIGIRANTAMVMGKIGDPAAIEPLRAVLYNEQEDGVKLAIEEALANLGNLAAKGRLEGYVMGRFVDVRINACLALAKYNPSRAKVVLRSLFDDEKLPPVKLIAAGELGRINAGDRETYEFCVRCATDPMGVLSEAYSSNEEQMKTESIFLRRQAILALGWSKQLMAVDLLMGMMKDADAGVRIAAATSVLRLLADERFQEEPEIISPKTDDSGEKTDDGSFIKEEGGRRKLHRSSD